MGLITDNLNNLIHSDMYPFHMPGGKRNKSLLKLDITEIDGFDDLHNPGGIIKKAMDKATDIYQTKQTFYLVNGSTCGILAAISAVTKAGDEIIVARNAHKSVYNALMLRSLTPRYIIPDILQGALCYDAISVEKAEKALEDYPNAKVMVLTSPTYEGEVSDIETIGKMCLQKGVLLIVDEAHGAHLYFHDYFPKGALKGADIVIQSLHKTLPALTPAALLHVNSDKVDLDVLKRYLSTYQTSSPSYILMASMEDALDEVSTDTHLWDSYVKRLENFYKRVSKNTYLKVLYSESRDRGKIVIYPENGAAIGRRLADILRDKYHLECEYCAPSMVLMMTSVMDTDEGFDRLAKAITEIDEAGVFKNYEKMPLRDICPSSHEMVYRPFEAAVAESESVDYKLSVGRIAKDNMYIYPPGRCFLVEGERITKADIEYIDYLKAADFEVRGLTGDRIKVIREL